MAPELLAGKEGGHRIDVYSFGIMVWELVYRAQPFAGVPPVKITKSVCSGERPPLNRSVPVPVRPELKDIVQMCWSSDPKRRPEFKQLALQLAVLTAGISTAVLEQKRDRLPALDRTEATAAALEEEWPQTRSASASPLFQRKTRKCALQPRPLPALSTAAMLDPTPSARFEAPPCRRAERRPYHPPDPTVSCFPCLQIFCSCTRALSHTQRETPSSTPFFSPYRHRTRVHKCIAHKHRREPAHAHLSRVIALQELNLRVRTRGTFG